MTGDGTNRLLGLFTHNGHVYGAIFTKNAYGRFEHYDAFDFIHLLPRFNTQDQADCGLLLPISHAASERLLAVVESLKSNKKQLRYYYHSYVNERFNPEFERRGRNPVNYDGSEIPVSQAERDGFERSADAPPITPTNCIHILLNACIHSAHIPLQELHAALNDHTYHPDALPEAVCDLGFYGEELTAPVIAKWVELPGDSAVITMRSTQKHSFCIPEDINGLLTGQGAPACAALLEKPPLDYTCTPTAPGHQVTKERSHAKLWDSGYEREGMSSWL